MLEYIFFDERPWRLFISFLEGKGVQPESGKEDQGFMVRLPDDTADELTDEIEAYYDEMLDMNEALYMEEQGEGHVHAAGVTLNLSDGRMVEASVDPKLLNRVLEVLSTDELGQFISAIVDAVEKPDERPFCRRH